MVGEFCHGTLAESDGELLDAVLESDAEARRFYNNYMFLHAELYAQHAKLGCETAFESLERRAAEFTGDSHSYFGRRDFPGWRSLRR